MCTQSPERVCGSDLVEVSAVVREAGAGRQGGRGPEAGDMRRTNSTFPRFPLKAQAGRSQGAP